MPNLPKPARLSLHQTIKYVAKRCESELLEAGTSVYGALGEGTLVASAGTLVSDRTYMAGIYDGPIPVGPPRRIDGGVRSVPTKVWAGYPWPSFQRRVIHPHGNRQFREHTVDGRQIGPVYVDPTLATADVDSWLDSAGGQPGHSQASDSALSSHPSSMAEQPIDQGQSKPIRRRGSAKRAGGRPEKYGEAKQQVFASLNAFKALQGLAWLYGKRPSEIAALLRDAVKEPLPGRTRLHQWIRDWRAEQADSPMPTPVCR